MQVSSVVVGAATALSAGSSPSLSGEIGGQHVRSLPRLAVARRQNQGPIKIDEDIKSFVNDRETGQSIHGCECFDLYDQCIPYMDAWTWQKAMVKKKMAVRQEGEDEGDALLILQHTPVYTLGTRSSEKYLLFDKDRPPCDLYRTERGGEVTYHGPGQLVMYPILNLRHFQTDLHWYLRSLEEVVIRALWKACGIEATRVVGLTGVWVGAEKVAAIGVRVSRWITYHGLALNVTTDLSPFNRIVPCGISSHSVGSVAEILKRRDQFQASPRKPCASLLQTEELLDLLHKTLLNEFSDVFRLNFSHICHSLSMSSTGLSI